MQLPETVDRCFAWCFSDSGNWYPGNRINSLLVACADDGQVTESFDPLRRSKDGRSRRGI